MSAGPFQIAGYEASYDSLVHPIKVQPETLAATFDGTANAEPAAADQTLLFVQRQKGPTAYGIGARGVRVAITDVADSDYKPGTSLFIPVLDESVWSAIPANAAVSINGATGVVTKLIPESTL